MKKNQEVKIIITARAIIINKENKLLLVKNEEEGPWFTPGGWLSGFETLEEACIREVREELGITIFPVKLVKIDYFRLTASQNIKWKEAVNKVEHYFLCDIKEGHIKNDANNNNLWKDEDPGHTKFVKYFSASELTHNNIVSKWLIELLK